MKTLKVMGLTLFSTLLVATASFATPSTTFWTPATMDIQSFGVLHVGVDNYFSVQKNGKDSVSSLPVDSGLTIGILPFEKVQMEVGIDALYPQDANNAPIYFNFKIGIPEDAFFKYQPMIGVGAFNIGTKKDKTDYDIGYAVIGKSFGPIRITAGGYYGNSKTLVDSNGNKANKGFMAAADFGFYRVGGEKDGYNKFALALDYASGKNGFGGYGGGAYYFFSKDVSLLVGPTFFNEKNINGKWKVTVQLDANINIFGS